MHSTVARSVSQLALWLMAVACWTVPIHVYSFTSYQPTRGPWSHLVHSIEKTSLFCGHDDKELELHPSRRRVLESFIAASASCVLLSTEPALAGKPEYDKNTGALYTPKAEMLSGGSEAARGTGLSSPSSSSRPKLQPGQALQSVYETRFIAYLSRFLLTFDPSANAWWVQNVGLADTWDFEDTRSSSIFRQSLTRDEVDAKFAEFAEAVEIGLADYFVGPYGSYGSLTAARAGISASKQVRSSRPGGEGEAKNRPPDVFRQLFSPRSQRQSKARGQDEIAKQGVLNLYSLLKARYTSVAAKRQLAILFSFFSNPNLQPTVEIRSLLGEADNATVSEIDLIRPYPLNEITSRTSSRRGGGYSLTDLPIINVEPPPALGADYCEATAMPVMKVTGRVLRIRVTDGGAGYTTAPEVTVATADSQRFATACAIIDRDGRIETVVVLDPGFGYGSAARNSEAEPPRVIISAPTGLTKARRALAVAELEYEIVGIDILSGGNGYVSTEPPKVSISEPKEDPDWAVEVPELTILLSEFGPVRAEVAQMTSPTGNLVYSMGGLPTSPRPFLSVDRILRDPTELLPSSVRPELNSLGVYIIPAVAAVPTYGTSSNPRFRAVDPLFGAIGTVPVTKSALELKPSEYGRLALSGAVCTVLVRTALNPLELIKTKQQLKNDYELLDFAQKQVQSQSSKGAAITESDGKIGSVDLIKSLVELRGPFALFQSADITFLASLMFGSFGFGATELFRRSFAGIFFEEGGSGTNSELILLLAATVATVITSFFAAPFELLRVRSMGLIEDTKWIAVLEEFLDEKSNGKARSGWFGNQKKPRTKKGEFSLKDLTVQDLLPLWAGFLPTASRELAFAIPKFLAFDVLAKAITDFFNSQAGAGSLPIQVGVGTSGLAISAIAGAFAGIAGAVVSHPADLILTYTSAASKKKPGEKAASAKAVIKDLLSREGGIANLYVGLTPRLVFFFLVIGLQFFLYDYVKNLLNVGSDDLSLVLDVFYAVRQGLIDTL